MNPQTGNQRKLDTLEITRFFNGFNISKHEIYQLDITAISHLISSVIENEVGKFSWFHDEIPEDENNFELCKVAVKSYLTDWLNENIEMLAPSHLIQKLLDATDDLRISKNEKTRMTTILNDSKRLLTDNNPNNNRVVCEKLDIFLRLVESVRESLTLSELKGLEAQATAIRNNLSCV